MADDVMELGQIEESDLPLLKDFLNSEYAQTWGFQRQVSLDYITMAYKNDFNGGHFFSLKRLPRGEFKKVVFGFCGVRNIDWVSRTGELLFAQVNESGSLLTVKDSGDTLDAFLMLVEFCFYSLGLNKVWFEMLAEIDVLEELEEFGFIEEGKRIFSKMVRGRPTDTKVYSVLRKDYDKCLE